MPYPGIATDYKPLIITMLAVADGVGIVTENLYPGRFRYVEELQRLGADVRTSGHHAVVRGVPRLSGAPVKAHDIRAGAAMVVAASLRKARPRSPACTTSTAATTTSSVGCQRLALVSNGVESCGGSARRRLTTITATPSVAMTSAAIINDRRVLQPTRGAGQLFGDRVDGRDGGSDQLADGHIGHEGCDGVAVDSIA